MSHQVLYLIRHGPTAYPLDIHGTRCIYGPTAELTDQGRAKCVALARAIYRQERAPLTVLATSPYPRAAQTADLLASELGSAQVITDMRLRDTDSSWEGEDAEAFLAIFRNGRTFDDPRTHETLGALGWRMHAAYTEIIAQFPEASIGIISHGDPLRALYYRLRHPHSAYPPYPDLVRMLSLDTAQGLRLHRASGGQLMDGSAYVSAE